MLRVGQVALVFALAAIPSFAVAVQEPAPIGQNRVSAPAAPPAAFETSAAAAACDNSIPRNTAGGGNVKRYKLTFLYALTEYNTGTCAPISRGSWAVTKQEKCGKPNCGKVTFGILTGLHLANGDCPDHVYNFAAICYTWNRHSNEAIKDAIAATWTAPDFNWAYQFPVRVPVVRPTSETTQASGWDGDGLGQWQQTLHSAPDPAFDWALNTVRETDPGTGSASNDTCHCPGSAIDPFWKITGGTWYPDEKGVWDDYDHVGWCSAHGPSFCPDTSAPLPVQYYRQKRRAPCGTTFPQQMQFQATNVAKGWVDYGPVNTLGGSFTYSTVTSTRAGQKQTHTVSPVAAKTRLTCAAFKPAPPPATVAAAFGASIVVNDPRPVAAAIEEIEKVTGRAITYEDPPFLSKNHMTPMVQGANADTSLLIPSGGSLRITLPADASPEQVTAAVGRMVGNYNASRGAATFSVTQGGLTHVVPQQSATLSNQLAPMTPVLDTRITVAAKSRSAMDLLAEICRAVSRVSGQPVGIGTVPTNALLGQRVEIGARNEPARNVLEKLIVASGMTLSWRLLYDPGLKAYYLNIPVIR
jgi:hypothetical protein